MRSQKDPSEILAIIRKIGDALDSGTDDDTRIEALNREFPEGPRIPAELYQAVEYIGHAPDDRIAALYTPEVFATMERILCHAKLMTDGPTAWFFDWMSCSVHDYFWGLHCGGLLEPLANDSAHLAIIKALVDTLFREPHSW